jgi:outer membrane biosynthesis protein TonB
MKPIQLSQDMLVSLGAKSVVVRVVIDNAGKVTEVAPLNQEGSAVSLPPDALATIQQWEFSRSRRKDAGEAVKYFSLKVQNPR